MAIYDKYSKFENLLLSFEETSYENMSDYKTIELFVEEAHKNSILGAIKQGKELLALPADKFPADWVIDITQGGRNLSKLGIHGYPGQRGWVKWMVEELEKEAKKQGKL